MNRATPELTEMHHIKLCYSQDRYCGWPRMGGFFNFGNGEIAVLHYHAPSRYQVNADISHSTTTGAWSRSKTLLQRSLDGGETWPRENDVVVWDESLPLEEKRAILYRADEPGVAREQIDGGYVNRCVNDIRRRPSQPLAQRRFHPRIECRDRRLRSTQGPSDA